MNKGGVFVIGAAIGAAAGLLLAPHSGSENREILGDSVQHYSESAEQLLRRAASSARDKADSAQQAAEQPTEDIRVKINEARDRIAAQVTRNRNVEDVEADVSDVVGAAEGIADDITATAPAEGADSAAPAEGAAATA